MSELETYLKHLYNEHTRICKEFGLLSKESVHIRYSISQLEDYMMNPYKGLSVEELRHELRDLHYQLDMLNQYDKYHMEDIKWLSEEISKIEEILGL